MGRPWPAAANVRHNARLLQASRRAPSFRPAPPAPRRPSAALRPAPNGGVKARPRRGRLPPVGDARPPRSMDGACCAPTRIERPLPAPRWAARARARAAAKPLLLLLALAPVLAAATASLACPPTEPPAWAGDAGGAFQGALRAGCAASFDLDPSACAAAGKPYVTLQAWSLDPVDAGAPEPVLAAVAGPTPPRASSGAKGWSFDPPASLADPASIGSGSQFVQWKLVEAGGGRWRASLTAAPAAGDRGDDRDASSSSSSSASANMNYNIAWRCDSSPSCPAPRPGAPACGGRGACAPLPAGCARGACAACACADRAGGAGCGATVVELAPGSPGGARALAAGGVESFAVPTPRAAGSDAGTGAVLIELATTSGAPRLSVAPARSSGGRGGLPAVPLDGGGPAGRTDALWRVVEGVAPGERVHASVAAAGSDGAGYRLRSVYSPPNGPLLCPRDCGADAGRGVCVEHGVCVCSPGYGGAACQGRSAPLEPGGSVAGRLAPRGWAFLDVPPARNGLLLRVASGDGDMLLIARGGGTLSGAGAPDAPGADPPSLLLPPGGDLVRLSSTDARRGCIVALHNPGAAPLPFDVSSAHASPTALAPWLAASAALGATAVAAGIVLGARAIAMAAVRRRVAAQGGGGGGGAPRPPPTPTPGLTADQIARFPTRACSGKLASSAGGKRPSSAGGRSRPLSAALSARAGPGAPPPLSRRSDDGPVCVVCVSSFAPGETLLALAPCGHEFHSECVAGWLARAATCPVCRSPAVPPTGAVGVGVAGGEAAASEV